MQRSIQSIIFGPSLSQHLPSYLKASRASGFEFVELGPTMILPNAWPRTESLLQDNGMRVSAVHCSSQILRTKDKFLNVLRATTTAGCNNLIVSGIVKGVQSVSAYHSTAKLLDYGSAIATTEGVRLHYHHHEWELDATLDGPSNLSGLGILRDRTSAHVHFVLDNYWINAAGRRFSHLWSAFRDCCTIVHLKDGTPYPPYKFAPLGHGQARVDDALTTLLGSRYKPHFLTYEQDYPASQNTMDCVYTSGQWLNDTLN